MPKKTLLLTLGPKTEKSQEELRIRRKKNDRRCPVNHLGPRILKIVAFGARRRVLHPHFGLGSNANDFFFKIYFGTKLLVFQMAGFESKELI